MVSKNVPCVPTRKSIAGSPGRLSIVDGVKIRVPSQHPQVSVVQPHRFAIRCLPALESGAGHARDSWDHCRAGRSRWS